MRRRFGVLLLSAALVGACTAAGAGALYYLSLPANPGPENSSPPPEGIGLLFGALLGTAVGVGTLVIASHSAVQAVEAFAVAASVAGGAWLIFGSGTLGSRAFDVVLGAIICGVG